MRRFALASLLLLGIVADAAANGRPSGTSTINFRKGHETDVIAGMTFGAVITHDNGATWHWFCEDAVGYAGVYDPDYAYMESGAIFATTFGGLVVNRNGCTFDPTQMGMKFSSVEQQSGNASLFVGIANSCGSNCVDNDAKIYRSDDDGMTFPTSSNPGMLNDWWQSIQIAPSDDQRIYISGYRFVPNPGSGGGTVRNHILLQSTDRGAHYANMTQTGIQTTENSVMEVVGVSATNPDILYLRVTYVTTAVGDAVYRSTNAGQSWTKILQKQDSISVLVRANGDVVASTPSIGSSVSTNCKTTNDACTFTDLVNPPHISCLYENTAGEVWACTQNYGGNQLPGDGFGIMKSTNLSTWTGVLKFQDILAPVDCPVGTAQRDKCSKLTWCAVKSQLGITADPIDCAALIDAGEPQAEQVIVHPPGDDKPGCCSGSGGVPGALVGAFMVGFVSLRRRKRCCS